MGRRRPDEKGRSWRAGFVAGGLFLSCPILSSILVILAILLFFSPISFYLCRIPVALHLVWACLGLCFVGGGGIVIEFRVWKSTVKHQHYRAERRES